MEIRLHNPTTEPVTVQLVVGYGKVEIEADGVEVSVMPLRYREPQLSMVDTVDGSDADGERRRAER